MNLDAPIHGQIDSTIPQPLGLCVRSLAALVKHRAHERDIARLERDLAIRERDTVRAILSATLGRLHLAERRNRLMQATRDVSFVSALPLGRSGGSANVLTNGRLCALGANGLVLPSSPPHNASVSCPGPQVAPPGATERLDRPMSAL